MPCPSEIPEYPLIPAADPIPWWQSRAIRGGIAVLLSQVASLIGYQLDAGPLAGVLTDTAGLAGGLVAIWGRVRAIQPVKL